MRTLLMIFLISVFITQSKTYKIDFGIAKNGNNWWVVNDGVMGGLSEGIKILTKNSILFKGIISLDNNGGFSSLRRSLADKDLTQYNEVEIRYRSLGISQALTFAVSNRWYIPNYKVRLEGTLGQWETRTIKLSDFKKFYLGNPMNDYLKKEAIQKIVRIGVITDEKKYGGFEFEIDYIEFKSSNK
ncbi:MAG: Uncharacterised protein [Flavobacterium sp. SCGC AAA160-P02]|nr:MAG: Uncharacterised protein [Flavobacterium sp. SCGC AAA160-P02]